MSIGCVCVFEEISSFDGLSQPPGAEPSTLKHIDSWAGDTGSVFGLSLLCPACHLCVCVCEAKRNCALWVGVQTRVCVCLTEKEK